MCAFKLESIHDFMEALRADLVTATPQTVGSERPSFHTGQIFCGKCQGRRRVFAVCLLGIDTRTIDQCLTARNRPKLPPRMPNRIAKSKDEILLPEHRDPNDITTWIDYPALFELTCMQCHARYTILIRLGQDLELSMFGEFIGGVASPFAPAGVTYYLAQAARCRSVGANTAAVAMYRSAAEWLLHEQGYTDGELGPKIRDLENALKRNEAPKWATYLETEALITLKKLGNTALHTNSGDLSAQQKLDTELCNEAQVLFEYLIDIVYDQPERLKQSIARLKSRTEK